MLLVDALYINSGGPKILLDYFISELEKTNTDVLYLIDKRAYGNLPSIKNTNKVFYLTASLLNRTRFYRKHQNAISKVFCMGNLPPTFKLSVPVYTYFHHPLLLQIAKGMPLSKRFGYHLKKRVLNHIKKNTNYWVVQTDFIKNVLQKRYELDESKILKIPFYEPLNTLTKIPERIKGQYIYASLGIPYKNHKRLIEAFCKFYDQHHYGCLTITLSDNFKELIELVNNKQKSGYPVMNVGFVSRNEIQRLFYQSEYHIFPSFTESLGLGIIESIDCGCKIIGADLPYMHTACEPSIIFDPMDEDAIVVALEKSMHLDVKKSFSKIENQIEDLLLLLN